MSTLRPALDSFFRPSSIAVVGASATPGSVGSILMRNLLENPFGGVVYPINPKRRAVHGVHCYPEPRAPCPRTSTWPSSPRRRRRCRT